MKKLQQNIQQKVMRLLAITQMAHAQMQYEGGLAYINNYVGDDAEAARYLESNRLFWNWWKNQWLLRDVSFTDSNVLHLLDHKSIEAIYHELHNPDELRKEIYPSGFVSDLFTHKLLNYELAKS